MANELVVLITAPSYREARAIGKRLVEEKLAACANIIPRVESVFFWQGRIRQERETLMILKTQRSVLERLMKRVKSLHSYSVPEIIALPIARGSKEYLRWVRETTR
ncbi:MAG TPA: divalent-cation tolerance protein CutA [Nitrospiria bacterium]|nr:divalent-cation tolerance protein CutA [Nitrospiria bacterium]